MKNYEKNEKYYIIYLGDNMKIKAAVSNRHVHLKKEDADVLFGENYEFNVLRPLSQTGQFACVETVTIKTDKNKIEKIEVNMGIPKIEEKIRLKILDKEFEITNISMGNPHAVIFVDDVITILREAEKKGINAWHISSFLDWDY